MKIGIIRESKTPSDNRVPLTPQQCRELNAKYPQVDIAVQPSHKRCFSNAEYTSEGIPLKEDLSDRDVLLGIKEVKTDVLIPGKTYLFFSHTAKMQPYNKGLLQEIIRKKVTLIDYEYLKDEKGIRIIGFGRWAGLVGAYNGIRAYCHKHGIKPPKPAYMCKSFEELIQEACSVKLPPVKMIITGNGRVAKGAVELLQTMGTGEVNVQEYLNSCSFEKPVFLQADVDEYNRHKKGKPFNMQHFFGHPEEYSSNFSRFLPKTDMLIMAAYWDSHAPKLFTREEMCSDDFAIRVISDITCDIDGAIPSTIRASTIEEPFYDYDPLTKKEEKAFSNLRHISVSAVDNLPNELPREASTDFGRHLINSVLPALINNDQSDIIANATISSNGELTKPYSYLQGWVET